MSSRRSRVSFSEPMNGRDVKQRIRSKSAYRRRMRNMLARHIELELMDLEQHRPYFSSLFIFIQIVSLVVSCVVFPIAPIAYETTEVSQEVHRPDGVPISATKNSTGNIFIGPPSWAIIALGGAYGPCMRRDSRVNEYVESQRNATSNFGCCVRSGGEYCYSTSQEDCEAYGGQTFNNDTVCYGQRCCNSGTFPGCEMIPEESLSEPQYDVCRCEVVARPCCRGSLGECSIETQDRCDFLGGYFQEDAVTCEEVDCLNEVCQLGTFQNTFVPDQWYRLILAGFVPIGILHTLALIFGEIMFVQPLENGIGSIRMMLIFVVSLVGGYTVGTILSPYQVKASAAPGLYGTLGSLIVQLIESWSIIKSPCSALFKLVFVIAISIVVGLFPFIDNYSQISGFVFGIVASFAFLPSGAYTSKTFHKAKKRVVQIIGLALVVALLFLSIPILFTGQYVDCPQCEYFNCFDFVEGLCENGALLTT
eukprot:m.49501 g.49501  ORF g.49501 m.49501 type:complete len:478 (-) comp10866_c0_seq5:262-1695(-)